MIDRARQILGMCILMTGCLLVMTAAVAAQGAAPADTRPAIENAFAQAKAGDVAILAPKKFADANKAFAEYQKAVRKGEKPDKLRQKAGKASAALKAANDAAALTRVALKDTLTVRQEACVRGKDLQAGGVQGRGQGVRRGLPEVREGRGEVRPQGCPDGRRGIPQGDGGVAQ